LRTKILPPIVLPVELYTRLERDARANERDALQQARWLLKQALQESDTPASATDRPSDRTAVSGHK
jgi:hypothetical protein